MLLAGRQHALIGYFITTMGVLLYFGIDGIRHKNQAGYIGRGTKQNKLFTL